jgi:hypothetical protein
VRFWGRCTCRHFLEGDGHVVLERLKTLIHEGNIRRVVVKHQGRIIAEFPLTAGVVGAVLAPVVAAIGTIIAMLKDCTVDIEKIQSEAKNEPPRAAAG